jgi:hypothetical protein
MHAKKQSRMRDTYERHIRETHTRDTYDSDGYERQIRETRSVKSKNNKKGFSTRIDQSINQQSISVRTIVKGCNRDREEGKVDTAILGWDR